jgi:hypothetical protein
MDIGGGRKDINKKLEIQKLIKEEINKEKKIKRKIKTKS